MNKEEQSIFKKMLYNESIKYGIELNNNVLNSLEIYKNLLLEWNEKINLTSITDEYEIIVKHFIDCLHCIKYIKENDKIIDIGTGAGFPGIVLAIYFEGKINITLIDSLNKRLIFLQEVVNILKLKNINIVHSRAEDKAKDISYREKYDISVARAVASLNTLCEYTSSYVRINGKCLYMKGNNIQEEIKKSFNALKELNLKIIDNYEYNLELNNDKKEIYNRCILEMKKIGKTPEKYPRNSDKIKKKSL